MQLANKSANAPCKVNPYHQSANNCLRNSQCPFKDKPAEMRPANFGSNEMVSINDQYCALCRSRLVACLEPPIKEERKQEDQPKLWLRWVIMAGLLLLGIGLWWFIIMPTKSTPDKVKTKSYPDSTVMTKPDTHSNVEKVPTNPATKPVKPPIHKPSLPQVENGFIKGIDPRDRKCKEFQYRNGKLIGQHILSAEECHH